MVKRPRRWNPVKHLKKAKVEMHHPQKPRHRVTLEDFLPCWLGMKISRDSIEASCFNADKGEGNSDDLPLAPSPEKLIESIHQEVNTCEEKVTFTNDDLILGDTLHNCPLYLVGYMCDERVNQILIDGGSSVNILPIRTVKELGIPMNELSESRVMIQGFNQGWQRAIGAIRLGITIEDMQSSTWLHVIDAKTLYNVFIGRPWIHENKVVTSIYHQCLKYYEGEVEKKIIVDDEPFTEAESYFVDAKFYLKDFIVKELKVDDVMNDKVDESTAKRAEVVADKTKVVAEKVHSIQNKSHKGNIVSHGKKVIPPLQYVPKKKKDEVESYNLQTNMLKGLTLPVKRIEAVKSSSIPLAGFVAQNRLQNVALPIKRTDEGFDPNAYMLFAKAGYNPNEPSKLGKLPSEATMRQPREGLEYKQPSPVHISIRRASNNYIVVEDEYAASNKPSVFDRLGKSTRMRRQTKLVVSCKEVLRVKPYIAVYTKERDEDEESMGSSYHVTVQGKNGVPSSMKNNAELEDVSPYYHIPLNDGDSQEDEDAEDTLPELEEGVKTTVDALKEVNLGTDEEPRPTYLSALLEDDEESTYIELLKEFSDVFAWSYKEIPSLDPKVAVHHLAIKNGARHVKQAQRHFRSDLVPLIETEVNKLIKAGFIREVKYPTRVSSIVPVRKKNGPIRVCVDFMDLNNASPKNEFSLTIPELMIDATTRVTSGKFFGFIVRHRGIEIDQAKVDAILKMHEPWDIHELKNLQGKLAYLRRFISNIAGRCQPFSYLMKKGVPFKWDQACSNALQSIKSYLLKPPVLAAPILGKSLILYISAQERSVGALLAQKNSKGKENSLYYLSRMMTPNELNYSSIEKLCLALVFSIQKLKHDFQALVVRLVSRANPIKFMMSKPVLSDRLERRYFQFQQFEIMYIPQKAIKGQALADFFGRSPYT
ncbi:uncharacterized protein [Nicotiana tomentosiformis]|uniref:uncharacterized protein n=1 Tax=Nicotiana tomentosiformis TaxID=4098 RepID=UPI00388CAF38